MPEKEPMLQFFKFEHLPPALQDVSRPFPLQASLIVETIPRNPERSAGLRKLLECKDCIVRAAMYKDDFAEIVEEPREGPKPIFDGHSTSPSFAKTGFGNMDPT